MDALADTLGDISVLSYLAAFAAGVISFLSPCVLPIVPGYLSVVTGLSAGELREGSREHVRAILTNTLLFIGGFTVVFVLLSLVATGISDFLFDNQSTFTRVSGVLVLAMALFMIGSVFLQAPWLYQEARFHPNLGRYGRFAPPVAGAAFGFGWSPCIGPVLAAILGIAAREDTLTAATLLVAYSAGLGVPFLAAGLAFGRATSAFDRVKRHMATIVLGSAAVLAVFGVVLVLDQLVWVTGRLNEGLDAIGLDFLIELG